MNKPQQGAESKRASVQRAEKGASSDKRGDDASGTRQAALRAVVGTGGDDSAQNAALQRMSPTQRATAMRGLNTALGNQRAGQVASASSAPQSRRTKNTAVKRSVQAKRRVSAPTDRLEREADELADAILRLHTFATPPRDDEHLDAGAPKVARGEGGRPLYWTHAPSAGQPFGLELPEELTGALAAIEADGSPLAASERAFFEPRLGVDLGDVRVHVGPTAAALCDALQAQALAWGWHVLLGSDSCAQGTMDARRLMAHELVHVLQQSGVVPRVDDVRVGAQAEGPPRQVDRATGAMQAHSEPHRDADRSVARPRDPAAAPAMPASIPTSRRHRRGVADANAMVMRAAKGDVNTDEIKVIADRASGKLRVVRVNKRGEIVSGLAEITPSKGEKLDAKQIEAEFNGRDYIHDLRTTAKVTIPKKWGITTNPRNVVTITRGTKLERKLDELELEAKRRRESVLAYLKEEKRKSPSMLDLDDAQIADIMAGEGYQAWAALDRKAALAWLKEVGSTDGKWLRMQGGISTYFTPDKFDGEALTAAARDPDFLRWQAERQAKAKEEEDARIMAYGRQRTGNDSISLVDARKQWEGDRRTELYTFLQNAREGGVTLERAQGLSKKELFELIETDGIDPEFAKVLWNNFQNNSYTKWEREQAATPGGLPNEVRNEHGELIGYQTLKFESIGLMDAVGRRTERIVSRAGDTLDLQTSIVLSPSLNFFQEMSRSVPILSHAMLAYEIATGDSLDLRDVYAGGRKLSWGERLDRYISFVPFGDAVRMETEAATGISLSGKDLDLIMQDLAAGNSRAAHARQLTTDERIGKLIMGSTLLMVDMEMYGRVSTRLLGDPHVRPRWWNMSAFDHKMFRLRLAVELRLRSHLFDPHGSPGNIRGFSTGTRGVGRGLAKAGEGGAHERVSQRGDPAPKEHVEALGVDGVPVKIDPSLGSGVSVQFVKTTGGLVAEVRVYTGPKASLGDIAGHAGIVRLLKKFEGVMGGLRKLLLAIKEKWTGRRTAQPFDPGFNTAMEIQKLRERIQERAQKLEFGDEAALKETVRQIKKLHDQIEMHQKMVHDPNQVVHNIDMGDLGDPELSTPDASPYARRRKEMQARHEAASTPRASADGPHTPEAAGQRQASGTPSKAYVAGVEDLGASVEKLLSVVDLEPRAKSLIEQILDDSASATPSSSSRAPGKSIGKKKAPSRIRADRGYGGSDRMSRARATNDAHARAAAAKKAAAGAASPEPAPGHVDPKAAPAPAAQAVAGDPMAAPVDAGASPPPSPASPPAPGKPVAPVDAGAPHPSPVAAPVDAGAPPPPPASPPAAGGSGIVLCVPPPPRLGWQHQQPQQQQSRGGAGPVPPAWVDPAKVVPNAPSPSLDVAPPDGLVTPRNTLNGRNTDPAFVIVVANGPQSADTVARPGLPPGLIDTEIEVLANLNRLQEVIWYLEYAGYEALAAQWRAYYEFELANGEIAYLKPLGGGITDSYIACYTNGMMGVWKPERDKDPGISRYWAEIGAYQAARSLKVTAVPVTVARQLNDEIGSLQAYVPETYTAKDLWRTMTRQAWMILFDHIIGNDDRNLGNWLEGLALSPMLIDHARAFHDNYMWRDQVTGKAKVGSPLMAPRDEDLIGAFKTLKELEWFLGIDALQWGMSLKGYIPDPLIDGAVKRLVAMQKRLRELEDEKKMGWDNPAPPKPIGVLPQNKDARREVLGDRLPPNVRIEFRLADVPALVPPNFVMIDKASPHPGHSTALAQTPQAAPAQPPQATPAQPPQAAPAQPPQAAPAQAPQAAPAPEGGAAGGSPVGQRPMQQGPQQQQAQGPRPAEGPVPPTAAVPAPSTVQVRQPGKVPPLGAEPIPALASVPLTVPDWSGAVPRPDLPPGLIGTEVETLANMNRLQEVIWSLEVLGDYKRAEQWRNYLEYELAHGDVQYYVPLGGGVTSSYLAVLDNGMVGVWKPQRDVDLTGSRFWAEIGVYRTARAMGVTAVPVTVRRKINMEMGSLQAYIPEANTPKSANRPTQRPAWMMLFDYIVGNVDRNSGNWLEMPGLASVLIDHALAFRERYLLVDKATETLVEGDSIYAPQSSMLIAAFSNRQEFERFMALNPREIGESMKGYVPDSLIETAMQRLQDIQAKLRDLSEKKQMRWDNPQKKRSGGPPKLSDMLQAGRFGALGALKVPGNIVIEVKPDSTLEAPVVHQDGTAPPAPGNTGSDANLGSTQAAPPQVPPSSPQPSAPNVVQPADPPRVAPAQRGTVGNGADAPGAPARQDLPPAGSNWRPSGQRQQQHQQQVGVRIQPSPADAPRATPAVGPSGQSQQQHQQQQQQQSKKPPTHGPKFSVISKDKDKVEAYGPDGAAAEFPVHPSVSLAPAIDPDKFPILTVDQLKQVDKIVDDEFRANENFDDVAPTLEFMAFLREARRHNPSITILDAFTMFQVSGRKIVDKYHGGNCFGLSEHLQQALMQAGFWSYVIGSRTFNRAMMHSDGKRRPAAFSYVDRSHGSLVLPYRSPDGQVWYYYLNVSENLNQPQMHRNLTPLTVISDYVDPEKPIQNPSDILKNRMRALDVLVIKRRGTTDAKTTMLLVDMIKGVIKIRGIAGLGSGPGDKSVTISFLTLLREGKFVELVRVLTLIRDEFHEPRSFVRDMLTLMETRYHGEYKDLMLPDSRDRYDAADDDLSLAPTGGLGFTELPSSGPQAPASLPDDRDSQREAPPGAPPRVPGAAPPAQAVGVPPGLRDTAAYKGVLAALKREPMVGGPNGAAVRTEIADTIFSSSGLLAPRFVTSDLLVIERLARYAPTMVTAGLPSQQMWQRIRTYLRITGKDGFELAIPDWSGQTHKLYLVPLLPE